MENTLSTRESTVFMGVFFACSLIDSTHFQGYLGQQLVPCIFLFSLSLKLVDWMSQILLKAFCSLCFHHYLNYFSVPLPGILIVPIYSFQCCLLFLTYVFLSLAYAVNEWNIWWTLVRFLVFVFYPIDSFSF